ncbi:hypothetical protein [Meiothermus rufus]|uniref:hypothetical protein n=1 Tax=Meiothermus rufus TaxID=604332 RepID=UPI00040DA748|nr:hypothetical protein [Meiothermus rufus]
MPPAQPSTRRALLEMRQVRPGVVLMRGAIHPDITLEGNHIRRALAQGLGLEGIPWGFIHPTAALPRTTCTSRNSSCGAGTGRSRTEPTVTVLPARPVILSLGEAFFEAI